MEADQVRISRYYTEQLNHSSPCWKHPSGAMLQPHSLVPELFPQCFMCSRSTPRSFCLHHSDERPPGFSECEASLPGWKPQPMLLKLCPISVIPFLEYFPRSAPSTPHTHNISKQWIESLTQWERTLSIPQKSFPKILIQNPLLQSSLG